MSNDIEINEILELIPHKYPFLLTDKVIDYKEGESCVGIKNLTYNESFFQGHFPDNPVMPGVLVIEAMAQTASVLVSKQLQKKTRGTLDVLFANITNAKFKRVVRPGDKLEMFIKTIKNKLNIWFFESRASVDGKVVAEAEFSAMLIRKNNNEKQDSI